MNAERSDLTARARIHAALGDPARLAIVDTLLASDAAPGELGAALDMPTNLVAHHLNILEEAGLITRTRSEADRRRTYVRLQPQALAAISAPGLIAARRVVFVCTQNSARSQLAAAIWARRSHVPATSAGTQPVERVHPRAIKVARRHGLDPTQWRTAHLDDVTGPGGEDLLIAVCDNAHEHLTREQPSREKQSGEQERRLHWSVPDPALADTATAFEAAYTELADRIDRLAPTVSPTLAPTASATEAAATPRSHR